MDSSLLKKLPAFPACAGEVIRRAATGLSSEDVVRLAGTDQILAGSLIQAANSAAYTWSGTVGNLPQAVMYLGEVRAARVLVSAAMKPILGVVGHQKLFDHSLEVAHVAVQLASEKNVINPADAHILGLLHDVGELLFKIAPPEHGRRLTELVAAGVEKPVAEEMAYGLTHAQAGASVLRHWRMPEEYATAVEFHHSPEKGGSAGSALLYLAEQWTDPDGDVLTDCRLIYSLETLNLTLQNFGGKPSHSHQPVLAH